MSHLSFDLPAGRQVEKLLDLSAEQAGGVEVEWRALEQVAKIKHGKDWKSLDAGDIPVYGSGGIMV